MFWVRIKIKRLIKLITLKINLELLELNLFGLGLLKDNSLDKN